MLKIIHTSDWHLGHQFHSYDCSEEQKSFLDQLASIVGREQPDALVVSGDVFDNQIPSNSVMTMFTEGLHRICGAAPGMRVVVTAGNHDSASRLEISRVLWHRLGVEVIGAIRRRDDGTVDYSRHLVAIGENPVKGFIVALPHVTRGSFPAATPMTEADAEERRRDFFARLAEELGVMRRSVPDGETLPTVGMAHLALAGCDITGHNPEIIGTLDCVDSSQLPLDCDYLALGHIHRCQNVDVGGAPYLAHYCGSPLPVSFDETDVHGVTVVEIDSRGGECRLRREEIITPHPVVTLPDHPGAAFADFDTLLRALAEVDTEAYVRARLKVADLLPANAYELAQKAASEGKGRFCVLQAVRDAVSSGDAAEPLFLADADSLREIDPAELAARHYHALFGTEMPGELLTLFNDCVEEARSGE